MAEHRSVWQKLFLNEKGEISFRKTGTVLGALGGFLLCGAIPGAQIVVAGKAIAAIGAMVIALGQFEKNDRRR